MLTVEQEGRLLVERLGGWWTPTGGLCRCPAHDDRSPSLSIRPGRSRLLLHCFAGCTVSDVLEALDRARLLEFGSRGDCSTGRWNRPIKADPRTAAAKRIWSEARALAGTPGESYLTSRGLGTASDELRFHPLTPHGPQPCTRFRPAIIAAVRDEQCLTGVHRTFLDEVAGTDVPRRCGLGRYGRGAVRFGGSAARLGLAEGIETALSVRRLFGLPCWAALGAERFGSVALPPATKHLVLFLDHDSGGRRAERLARAEFGREVRIEARYPERPGEDWNDVLRFSAATLTAIHASKVLGPTAA